MLTFALLPQRVLVVPLLHQAALASALVLQLLLQLCQPAVELQVQAQSAGFRLSRQETSIRDQWRAGRGERGERGAGR